MSTTVINTPVTMTIVVSSSLLIPRIILTETDKIVVKH